jgi:antitoxin component of RelBE/YafQ-DinJ toxin-antitoxin module
MDLPTATLLREFASETGISVSTFINVTVRQALRSNKLVIERELKPTPYLIASIKRAEEEYARGDVVVTKTAEESDKYLRSLMSK